MSMGKSALINFAGCLQNRNPSQISLQALRSKGVRDGGMPHPAKVFWQYVLFFEKPFKFSFFENIKSEIVNIQ